ncbi:TPA: hypothetical protein ACPZN0_004041 [Yersinia enterocolitica]
MKKLIIALAVLVLAGCATEVVPPSKAISATSDRVFKYQQVFPDQATLVVVRDSGYIGGGCYATVFINGDRVAKLDPKEKASFNLPAGTWTVGATWEGAALCSAAVERQERDVSLVAGKSKTLRIFTDSNGTMDVKPTTIE